MTASQESVSTPCRRTVVAAVGTGGLAVALTACGGSDKGQQSEGASSPSSAPAQQSDQGGKQNPAGGAVLAKTADIPVGGGKVFKDEGVVVTQPTAGEFKAFSNICTHQGCSVNSVSDGTINCPCHGSKYSIVDGSVKHPPAPKPLPAKQIQVAGEEIKLG
ncbi:Rieske 2Fe-2S domain-containing protein [Streptomyces sp. NPDC002004]